MFQGAKGNTWYEKYLVDNRLRVYVDNAGNKDRVDAQVASLQAQLKEARARNAALEAKMVSLAKEVKECHSVNYRLKSKVPSALPRCCHLRKDCTVALKAARQAGDMKKELAHALKENEKLRQFVARKGVAFHRRRKNTGTS